MTPETIVQHQLDAYNRRDLDAFLAVYSDTVQVYRLPALEPALFGKAQLAEFYGSKRFTLPDLHAELLSRIVMGNKVIDHERIRGLGPQPVEAMAIYSIVAGKIERAWFLSPD